ncbi:hypothetical protein BZA77DRAFT_292931 [Pyronema omphalodes]|nr:hypothetical protein BZA77DRAFT_292931 [Pyronema omphalodes]
MDVATAAGIGLAIPGVFDTLIKTCLKGYSFFSEAHSAGRDFEDQRYQFTVEQKRLKDLTTIVVRKMEDSTLTTDDERFLLISSTLIRIAQQFLDFKQLENLYGVRISFSNESAEKTSKRFSIRRCLGWRKFQKNTKSKSDSFEAVLTLDDLHLDENLKMATLQHLESPLKNVISVYSRLRWACLDSEKVKTLISKLEKYNSNMANLVDGLKNEYTVGTMAAVAVTTNDKPHFLVPFPKNKNFIGRSQISLRYEHYRQQQIASGQFEDNEHLRLALCGLGGIGKTQDVLSFIYEYKNKRPVFWIHAGSIAQFEADCQKLASLAKIPGHDDKEQKSGLIVRRWLESPESGDWILVLDNADNLRDFYPTAPNSTSPGDSDTTSIVHGGIANFIPRGSKGTIIITTRDREVARNLAHQNVIFKSELSPEQALELFYHHYPKEENASEDINTALSRLLTELQYLPLAIVQVAAYLDLNRSISPSKYLKMFEDRKQSTNLERSLSKPHGNIWRDNGSNADTILTTFSISFRQIQEQSRLADSFLRFMACIDRKAIPRDLLLQIHLDGVGNDFLISEALDKLVNFSILQHANVDFGSGKGYEIHALVHLAMGTYLESGGMDAALNTASTVLANTLPFPKHANWAAWRVYLPHVIALLGNVKQDSEKTANLCTKAGNYLEKALGKYSESLKLYHRARKIYAGLLGEESDETLRAMTNVGSMLRLLGRLKEAQKLQEKVLEVRRRTLGEVHPDTLRSMNNLAVTYRKLGGRLKEVQELQEKSLEVWRRTLGEEHPDTLISMNNLALTYRQLGGRLKEVQELEEKVLEVRRRTLREEHPDTLKSMNNLANTYREMGGRLKEVQELQEKVLEVRRRTLGEEHPDTLASMNNLANTHREMGGRLKGVQELQEKVLEVRRRTRGEEHPDTLSSMNNLAVTYKELGGRLKEVQELEEKVLEVRRRTLGVEHPDTLKSMNNLAATYAEMGGRLKEVQELEEKVLEVRRRTLGEEHPDTLASMNNLANTYRNMGGRLKEVQELQEKVLEVRRRTLGEEHPDTLMSMSNLAVTYEEQGGRLKEVQELEEKVLEVRRRTLGEEHPDTLSSMNNLANTYSEMGGRLKEVQELEEKVLEVRRRTLGEEHPDTLMSMSNLAVTYEEQGGRLKEVQELEEKVLEVRRRTLGEEHPDTLSSMNNLANTYSEMGGRLKEVQELEEKVLEVRRRTLGEEHPDTLGSMNNLAATYAEIGGRLKEVQELEEKVLEVRRRTLGEEHPDTLGSMKNLVITYEELGMLAEAHELEEKVRFARNG